MQAVVPDGLLPPLTVVLAAFAVRGCATEEELTGGEAPESQARPLVGTTEQLAASSRPRACMTPPAPSLSAT